MKAEELIEKFRFWIGGILILLIVGGSAVLIWRENYAKPKLEERMASNELRIKQLENDLAKKQDTGSNDQINPNEQNSNIQTEQQVQAEEPANQNSSNTKTTSSSTISGTVNLNSATLSQLDSLPGIGPVYAQRIIDYREAHGGFKNVDEVKNVKGIGEKTFEKFKDKIGV